MNGKETSVPEYPKPGTAAYTPVELNPEKMTSQERIRFINDARNRRLAGEELSMDELRAALRCLRIERKASAASSVARAKKPAVQATSLSEF